MDDPISETQPTVLISVGTVELLLAALGLVWLAAFASWNVASKRHAERLQSARLKWQEHAAAPQEATVCECFTAGWFNVLMKHLWPAYLEKRVSAICSRRIVILLQRLLQNQGGKVPFRFISGIDLQEFSLGPSPPTLSSCKARYFAKRNYLQFELGLDFTSSSGMQGSIAPKMKGGITGCIKFSRLSVKGRALLGLQLGASAPGVSLMNFSFVEPPDIDVQITPLGLTVTDFPGVKAYIKDAIVAAVSRAMVEPKRTATDVTALYARLRAEQQGGPGGLLVVTVLGAQGLRALAPSSHPHQASKLQQQQPAQQQQQQQESQQQSPLRQQEQQGGAPRSPPECYCEMKAGAEVFRTPVTASTSSPHWNWQFDLKLPAPIGSHAWAEELLFTVFDAQIIGDPLVLGTCQVRLGELELVANATPTDVYLPLLSSSSSSASSKPFGSAAGPLPQIHLGFQLLQRPSSAPAARGGSVRPPPPGTSPVTNRAQRAAEITATSGVSWQLPPQPAAVGAEESRQLQEIRQLLSAEQFRRQAAEKQFSVQAKENARLQRRLHERRSSPGPSTPTPAPSSPGLLSRTASGYSSPAKASALSRVQTNSGELAAAAPDVSTAQAEGGTGGHRLQRVLFGAFGEALGDGIGATGAHSPGPVKTRRSRSTSDPTAGAGMLAAEEPGPLGRGDADTPNSLPPDLSKTFSSSSLQEMGETEILGEEEEEGDLNGQSERQIGNPSSAAATLPERLRNGTGNPSKTPSVDLLVRLAKLERQVQTERQRYHAEIEDLKMEAAQLEEELASEQRRKLYEELRALCEGAKFRIHKQGGIQVRRVWVDPDQKALMWRAHKPDGRSQPLVGSSPVPEDEKKIDWSIGANTARKMPIKLIDRIVEGTDMFPTETRRPWSRMQQLLGLGGAAGASSSSNPHGNDDTRDGAEGHEGSGSGASKDKDEADPSRSFSIIFTSRTAIHLEIPPHGNGRSRAEWVSALQDLKNNLLDLGLQDPVLFPDVPSRGPKRRK